MTVKNIIYNQYHKAISIFNKNDMFIYLVHYQNIQTGLTK